MTAAFDERQNMTTAIVKDRAQAIAESVDWESVGIDPITIITWVQMISKLLEFVLPTLAECLHMNDDVTPSTAQQRVATMQSRNADRLLRRTKLNVTKQNRRAARKDSSIQLLDDQQATVLAKAIIGHTLRDNECSTVFAACLAQVA